VPNGFIDKCDMLATHIHGNTTGGGNTAQPVCG